MADDHVPSAARSTSSASAAAAAVPSTATVPAAASATAGSGGVNAVASDRFLFIRIEGMHCHKCETAIKKTLQRLPGVHEVEVDFASGQASVLFDPILVAINQLVDGVKQAGYKPAGVTQSDAQG
jgi:copper chaperone CopZ